MYNEHSYDQPRDFTKLEWVIFAILIIFFGILVGVLIYSQVPSNESKERKEYIETCKEGDETLVIRNDLGTVILNCKFNTYTPITK